MNVGGMRDLSIQTFGLSPSSVDNGPSGSPNLIPTQIEVSSALAIKPVATEAVIVTDRKASVAAKALKPQKRIRSALPSVKDIGPCSGILYCYPIIYT